MTRQIEGVNVTDLQKLIVREMIKSSRQNEQGFISCKLNSSKIAASRRAIRYTVKFFEDAGLVINDGEILHIGTSSGIPVRDLLESSETIPSETSRYGYKQAERDLLAVKYRLKTLIAQTLVDEYLRGEYTPPWISIDSSLVRAEFLLSAATKKLQRTKSPQNKKRLLLLCGDISEQVETLRGLIEIVICKKLHKKSKNFAPLSAIIPPTVLSAAESADFRALFSPRGINLLYFMVKKSRVLSRIQKNPARDSTCKKTIKKGGAGEKETANVRDFYPMKKVSVNLTKQNHLSGGISRKKTQLSCKKSDNFRIAHIPVPVSLYDSIVCDASECAKLGGNARRARLIYFLIKNLSCEREYDDFSRKGITREDEQLKQSGATVEKLIDLNIGQRLDMMHRLSERLGTHLREGKASERTSSTGTVIATCDNAGLLNLVSHRIQVEFNLYTVNGFVYKPESKNQSRFFRALKMYSKKTGMTEEDLVAGVVSMYRHEDSRGRFYNLPPSSNWIGSELCMTFLLTVASQTASFAPTIADLHQEQQDEFEQWLTMANDVFTAKFGRTCEGAYGAALVDLNKYRLLQSMQTYYCRTPEANFWLPRFVYNTGKSVSPREWVFAQVKDMTGGKKNHVLLPHTGKLIDDLTVQRAVTYVESKQHPTTAMPHERESAERTLKQLSLI